MKENIESKYVGNRKMIIELRLKAKPIIIDRIGELAERMENEKGLYVALGVYIGELQKRADLKNDEIRKSVHIGHSTFNDLKKGQNAH